MLQSYAGGEPQTEMLRFVGSTSPPGSLLQHAAASSALRRLHAGRRWSIIDGCGFVEGAMAEEFQYNLLDLLRPQVLVRIGDTPATRRSSLPFEGTSEMETRVLPISSSALPVSPEIRMKNRLQSYAAYFRRASQGEIRLSGLALRGKLPDLSPGSSAGGLLFSFCDAEQWVLALGIVSAVNPAGHLHFVAPPFSLDRPAVLQFGSLRLIPQDGRLVER